MRNLEELELERTRLLDENSLLLDAIYKAHDYNKELIDQNTRMLKEIKTLKKIIKTSDSERLKSMKLVEQHRKFLERSKN